MRQGGQKVIPATVSFRLPLLRNLAIGNVLNRQQDRFAVLIAAVEPLCVQQNCLLADREISPPPLGHESGMKFGEKRTRVSAQREVRITNELGLHARPAAEFVKRANSFRSEIWVVKGGKRYSAASLIDILRANLDCGATATLEAHGVDAEEALERLERLLAEFHEREKT